MDPSPTAKASIASPIPPQEKTGSFQPIAPLRESSLWSHNILAPLVLGWIIYILFLDASRLREGAAAIIGILLVIWATSTIAIEKGRSALWGILGSFPIIYPLVYVLKRRIIPSDEQTSFIRTNNWVRFLTGFYVLVNLISRLRGPNYYLAIAEAMGEAMVPICIFGLIAYFAAKGTNTPRYKAALFALVLSLIWMLIDVGPAFGKQFMISFNDARAALQQQSSRHQDAASPVVASSPQSESTAPPPVTITNDASGETALIEAVKIGQVLDGFTFQDQSGRTFKLLALRKHELGSRDAQVSYERDLKTILTNWLHTPGETVHVMHDNARSGDGTIPALVLAGDNFNVNLMYVWVELARVDSEAPHWFNLEQFRADAANVPQGIREKMERERR
jgi:hypothetical protein